MSIRTCERCGEQTAKLTACSMCKKIMCNFCIKSSRRKSDKIGLIHICKSCWGDIKKRKKFKSDESIASQQIDSYRF